VVEAAQSIRTACQVSLVVNLLETKPAPAYQCIALQIKYLRRLGLTCSAIANVLRISDKTVAKAANWRAEAVPRRPHSLLGFVPQNRIAFRPRRWPAGLGCRRLGPSRRCVGHHGIYRQTSGRHGCDISQRRDHLWRSSSSSHSRAIAAAARSPGTATSPQLCRIGAAA